MPFPNGNHNNTPTYASAHFYTDQEVESDNSYESSTTNSDTSCSDISEEEEWEQEVNPKGELFFVRSHFDEAKKIDNPPSTASPERLQNTAVSSSSPTSDDLANKLGRLHRRMKWSGRERDSRSASQDDKVANRGPAGATARLTREVTVAINPRQPNFGRRSSQLEAVVGIIPARIAPPRNDDPCKTSTEADVVVVQALVPGSEASKIQDIHIGDLVLKINDTEVTWSNLDQIVSSAASSQLKQVKLTLGKNANTNNAPSPRPGKIPDATITKSELLLPKLLSGADEKWLKITTDLMSVPHVVLYLTLATSETTEPKEDILYQFPRLSNKLVEIRGALITLSHMLPDIVGSQPISSSVLIGSHVVHIGYAREGKEVMLLALPAKRITAYQISQLTNEVADVLKFQYGSLHNAFSDESNRLNVDHLFALTFVSRLSGDSPPTSQSNANQGPAYCGKSFAAPQWVPLSTDLQTCIDELLNELEAADFADMSEDQFHMRRLYNIVGTCLFYKGYLVANHLPKSDLSDAFLYLHYMGLLETSVKNLSMQAVVWREVFPSSPHESDSNTRWFLLVVGQCHTLLGVLLEAGGCASRAVGPQGPDAFYVDQAQTTLLQLDVQQISKSLDSWLESAPIPSLASPDSFLGQNKKGKLDMFASRSSDNLNQTIKGLSSSKLSLGTVSNRPPSQTDLTNLYSKKEQQTQGETDSDSTSLSLTPSGTSDDTTPILGRRGRDGSRRQSWSDADSQDENDRHKSTSHHRYLPSILDLTMMAEGLPAFPRDWSIPAQKLTAGPHNVLFHYLQLNSADGVFIAPTHYNNARVGSLHSDIICNFKASCQIIHKMIKQSTKRDDSDHSKNALHSAPFIEQGMMFKCQTSSKQDTAGREAESIFYWAVGRLFLKPYQREVYVCYHDSCPQTIVEIAFQLSFGLPS